MIDHSSDSRFSTGVPVSAIRAAAGRARDGPGLLGGVVLDGLRLIASTGYQNRWYDAPMGDEKKQLRAIVAKRLSHLTEATTHLVTETETIEAFCKRKNYIVVAETENLDVSGGKPIRERPKIGQWLTLDHLDDWDVLVIYKLDPGIPEPPGFRHLLSRVLRGPRRADRQRQRGHRHVHPHGQVLRWPARAVR